MEQPPGQEGVFGGAICKLESALSLEANHYLATLNRRFLGHEIIDRHWRACEGIKL